MRCPKCGYITFDHLEVCSKCNKNIAKATQDLSGTIFKATPPSFLQFEFDDPEEEESSAEFEQEEESVVIDLLPDEEEGGISMDLSMEGDEFEGDGDEDDFEFDFSDEGEESLEVVEEEDEGEVLDLSAADDDSLDLDLDDQEAEESGGIASLDLDLGGLDLDDTEDEPTLDLGSKEEADDPSFDLSDFDISDLAPPDKAAPAADPKPAGTVAETPAPPVPPAPEDEQGNGLPSLGLGDLAMDDIDLEVPSLAPAGSATGKKINPSAKTGTALDNFDIDLGGLGLDDKK